MVLMEINLVVEKFLNTFAPIFSILTFFYMYPGYLCFKSLHYAWRSIFTPNLAGKVVVIVGASSGIGEFLAYEYGRRGAYLVIGARRENALRQVAEGAYLLGSPAAISIPTDISNPQHCSRLIQAAIDRFGQMDYLVLSAGIISVSMFEDTFDVTDFESVMDTNFWGPVYATYYAAPYLRKTKGRIVAISASTSWLNAPWLSFYNASKAGLVSFFETMRIEFGSDIGITIVTPGMTESEITKGKFLNWEGKTVVDQQLRDAVVSAVPIEPVEHCAKAIVDSACRGDKYLTVPQWFRTTFWIKMWCCEAVDWFNRLFFVTDEPGNPPAETISKKVMDLPGLKDILWPDSIRSPNIKTD